MQRIITFFICLLFLVSCQSPEAVQEVSLPEPDSDHGALNMPAGFGAFIVADTLKGLRHIVVRDNGDIYVSHAREQDGFGRKALRDTNNDGRMDSIVAFANTVGTGMNIHKDYLYMANDSMIFRAKLQADELLPAEKLDTLVFIPKTNKGHRSKTMTFDGEGNMYVNVGSFSNACQETARTKGSMGMDPCPELTYRAGIWRFSDDKLNQTQEKDGFHYGKGIRNGMALRWNTASNSLYCMQHGRDQLNGLWPEKFTEEQSALLPSEEFLQVHEGEDFGWPYCYYDHFQGKKILAPEYGGDGKEQGRCEGIKSPVVAFPGHMAPNDLLFYTGDQFPDRYKNGAFIAFHGSWNRAPYNQGGYFVAFVPMADGKATGDWEVFADGFVGPNPVASPRDAVYRPCGLAQGPDGSIYVTDSRKGRIWRIAYYGEDYESSPSGGAAAPKDKVFAVNASTTDSPSAGELAVGQASYEQYCAVCHMKDGAGVPGMNPPLQQVEWVTGDKERLIGIVLNGLREPLEINGETYRNAMAAFPYLKDEQISDILTYVRSHFGNEADAVTVEEVKAVRGDES